MKNEKANKKEVCKKFEKTNIIVEGSDKMLRNKNLSSFGDKDEEQGGEEMTSIEALKILEILKEKDYTLEEAIEIFKRIAGQKITINVIFNGVVASTPLFLLYHIN